MKNSEFISLDLLKSLTTLESNQTQPVIDACLKYDALMPEAQLQLVHRGAILSPFLALQLSLNPKFCLDWLKINSLADDFQWEQLKADLQTELQACNNDGVVKGILRRWRNGLMSLIALRFLNRATTIEQDCADIAKIADLLINATYRYLWPGLCQQWGTPLNNQGQPMNLLIAAMGKYGGSELNFSSDVDLIFFYDEDGLTQQGKRSIEHQTFFIRFGQQLIQLLSEQTRDGFVYRVDMRLRPYGDSGPLALSFAAAEDYYQEQGREWERFAMIKARLINGHPEEQHYFYQMIRPFVYRRYIDFGVLDSIREMKAMIETEVRRKGLINNIKLGSGGIREAEFIVQSLQLIRGGRLKHLQVQGYAAALTELQKSKTMTIDVANQLLISYQFLRRLEHVLQAQHDAQTQTLPDQVADQLRVALSLGFSDYATFLTALDEHRELIRREFANLFRPSEVEMASSASSISLDQLDLATMKPWIGNVNPELQIEFADKLGQFVASSVIQHISRRGRTRLESLLPKLIQTIIIQSNPIETLLRILNLIKAVIRRTAYLVLLEQNPPVLDHLVRLCSQSERISSQLAQFPILLDELLYPNSLYQPLKADNLVQELHRHLLRIEPEEEEQQQDQLRIFKQTNELRIAAACLNQTINVRKVSRLLSQVAQAIVASVTQLAWQKLCSRYGVPNIEGACKDTVKGFAVIAYGKFGGEELGFGSDLDVVFLYDAEPELLTREDKQSQGKAISHAHFFTRLAQRIIHTLNMRTLSGVLYEVDTRLRPSGNSGMLVSHLKAFYDYQYHQAWTWEHQALTRARAVCGDNDVIQWFGQLRIEVLSVPRDAEKLTKDVVEMRQKMRATLDKSSDTNFDIKHGIGGMVDIEFIAQKLVLGSGAQFPNHQWSSRTTRQFIDCVSLGIVDKSLANQLIESYRQYRELNNFQVLTGQSGLLPLTQIAKVREPVMRIWQLMMVDQSAIESDIIKSERE